MRQPPFLMERWQSLHEHRVDVNLSESGVHPLTLGELRELTGAEIEDVRLGYTQSDGTEELRERIAAMYDGASRENVVVTTGSAEANFVALWKLVEPGDHVVVLRPAYAQTEGLCAGLGARVESVWLDPERGWQPPPGAMAEAIGPGTKLVIVTHPNNPTGAALSDESVREIAGAVEAAGAWLLADEVYAGAELNGSPSRSFWGSGERLMISHSLSKAYGLPGLRLGWLVLPAGERGGLWERKDYTTIAPSALSDHLATAALEPATRARLLERTRRILTGNLGFLARWLEERADRLFFRPPDAGAICFVRYDHAVGSTALAERLLAERSVLVVPGDHFGIDGYLRIGYGIPHEELEAGLEALGACLDEVDPC
ncbi:MAG: aminotransferase class I/II-fold pyridoxal phosphate-dependent enzyme [Gemmatimonadota bacterium]